MTNNPLFVSGMFRSGTTLLGRMLNAHPGVSVASDPFLPFFKHARSAIAAVAGIPVATETPLQDYYFSSEGGRLLEAILASDLRLPLNHPMTEIQKDCAAYGTPYAPHVAERIGELEGDTYAAALSSMFRLVRDTSGCAPGQVVGFKEVWADEFIPALVHACGLRAIQIVRDPRAVCASKNASAVKYPWLFLCRQWRKLASLAHLFQLRGGLGGRVLAIRFEDLVTAPLETAKRMCTFLEINFNETMADPRTYVDGRGNQWLANSTTGKAIAGFDTGSVDRWRTVLTAEQVRHIESLCWPEMALWGYQPTTDCAPCLPMQAPRVIDSELAGWVSRAVDNSHLTTTIELLKEGLRNQLLQDKSPRHGLDDLVRGAFLSTEIFQSVAKRDLP